MKAVSEVSTLKNPVSPKSLWHTMPQKKKAKSSVVLPAPAESAKPKPVPSWVWGHGSLLPWGTLHG